MDCSQIDRLLNDYMDDALTDDDLKRLEKHCELCADCRGQYLAARSMKTLFSEMTPEVAPSLQAQANWRRAVQAEARQRRRGRIARMAGGIAAALVVALGVTFMLKGPGEGTRLRPVTAIEADGEAAMSNAAADEAAAPIAEVHMMVSDVADACEYLQDLVSEYEGTLDTQPFEAGERGANLYIRLPAENLPDFIEAAAPYDVTGALEAPEMNTDAPHVELLMVVTEAK